MPESIPRTFRLHADYRWRVFVLLLAAFLATYELTSRYLPASALLHPANAFLLAALFFTGVRLWPAAYLTALAAAVIAGDSSLSIAITPVTITLQAVIGAYLLGKARVDPLFRRYRDMFYFIAVAILISFISPAFEAVIFFLHHVPTTDVDRGHSYAATLFCFLIITPFLLRWLSKTHFARTPAELAETTAVFAALIGIDYLIFTRGIRMVLGIPLVYVLLIPLFLIALRLRPRFVTLAMIITSLFAIAGVLLSPAGGALADRLFTMESFLIVLAAVFYIIVSLEEDRRVVNNLIRTQLNTLENANIRISSESNAKNDFIAILAHELRNPLAPIVSGIEILRLKGVGDAEDAENLALMADRFSTVSRILDDLLDITRIAEGKITLKRETFRLETALRRAVLSTEHHRKEMHQSLAFKMPDTPLLISGDAVRIEQVFSNLLTNASKYSNSGDTIKLIVRQQDRIVEIEVSDEGIGLAPESLETIFMPFQQIEQGKRSQKGLGIGLALVRSLVEMHHGTVTAASEGPGRGSRFTVRLPIFVDCAHQDKKADDAPRSVSSVISPENSNGGLSVLIVDDNDAASGSMGRLLELKGCAVIYAYTGAHAIEKALFHSPKVILLDIGLPDMDGYAVTKSLRARGYLGRIIGLSGYGAANDREKGKQAGFDHYLVKPAGLADLLRVLPELG
jgi:signal transduction histidine kinase/CheY-like chemotaxis protein